MMSRILFAIWLVFAATSATAQDWRLVDADQIAPGGYVILTVPLDEPDALIALAEDLESDFDVALAAEWPLLSINVHCLVFDARSVDDVGQLVEAFEADARVRTAQRINGFEVSEARYPDPLFPIQWSLETMNIPAVHEATRGAGIRVGIVDSAIDQNHPDLADRVVDARDFVAVARRRLAEDHGTAVAGIIAAEAANVGIVGVAPQADLIGLRACWQTPGTKGVCNSFSLARAVNYAILNEISVLNLSLGGPEDALLAELIEAAVAQGTIVVAAAGESEELAFPASLDTVIAAGGSAPDRVPAPMSNVISTAPGETHRYVSGSSIATAHVSGVVALMLSTDPTLTSADVAPALRDAVRATDASSFLDACVAIRSACSQ